MEVLLCEDCDYCRKDRQNEKGQVRCTRFAQWVNSNDKSCESIYNEKIQKFCESLDMRRNR
jgi:hypothetical protein